MIDDTLSMVQALQRDFEQSVAVPSDLPVEWPNAPFEASHSAAIYASFHVLISETDEQLDIGAEVKSYRKHGVVHVNLFARPGSGEGAALTLADTIAARYRTVEIGGCSFDTPTVEPGTRTGNWWRVTVRCPFDAQYAA